MRVTAKIPDDRTGVYLRNGTNTQFDKKHVRIHAFVGAGMLHQIQIRNGAATYSNTYIRTPRFLAEEAIGREAYSGIPDVIGGGKTTLLIGWGSDRRTRENDAIDHATKTAGSTGRCNTFRELVCWGLIEQGLSGPFIELPCYRAEFGLAM